MPVLYRRHNYGVVTLEQTSVDYLPVGLPDGSERFSNWRGFIDHHTAWFLQAEGLATPVVLPCCSWEPTRFSGARVWLDNSEGLQGLLINDQVYAVTAWGVPQVVAR